MRVKLKQFATKIPLIKEQIQKYLYEIIENKIQLDNVKYKEMEKKSNLKEIKAQRNNVIAERISLSKELETVKYSLSTLDQKYLNNNAYNTMLQSQIKSSPVNSIYHSNTLINMQNYTSVSLNNESDSVCNELEQKISQLKAENSKFYETIDMLNEEIVENESVNKNLKVQLKNWDKILDSLVKERNSARSANGKYGSNKKYGSVI
jgi:chromosome segregation ATPase